MFFVQIYSLSFPTANKLDNVENTSDFVVNISNFVENICRFVDIITENIEIDGHFEENTPTGINHSEHTISTFPFI
jgi:hypothetical protein